MKYKFLLLALLAFTYTNIHARYYFPKDGHKTTLASAGEGDYDIKYLKFKLQLSDTSKYIISGDVSTTAQVIAASMTNYIFELDATMTIDSAKVNGTLYPVSISGFTRTITLPSALTSGAFFTAEIFYHGMPPTSGISFFNGITHDTSAHGTHMIYTVSDPWVAKDWWPSKQSANDKIDSVDMYVKVPRGVADGSNGVLVGIDSVSTPGWSTYHWQTHYPIDYYLVSIAIAPYTEYKSWLHFTGSTDSMLIQNFFIDTATFNPTWKPNFDSIGVIIDYFSSLFGRYPFWHEKYGMCFTTLGGGMENQTMTTIGVTDTRTIAHELTHQWFGDNVTYTRWGEMWLSEGMATLGEILFFDHFWGPAAALAQRKAYYNSAMGGCSQVFVTDTSGPLTLFNQPSVYYKGMAVANMLRYAAPVDSMFFQVLRTYQANFALGNASTNDLKAIAESVYGYNLDTFFNQWIWGKGYPKFKVSWDQAGGMVVVKLVQVPTCPATTSHFSNFLEMQLHGPAGDTVVKVYNSLDTQTYTFNWTPTMDTVYLNPDYWTLCRVLGTVGQDTTLRNGLSAKQVQGITIRVFPNPSGNYWQIEHIAENTALTLSDVYGKVLWSGRSGKGITKIPGEKLPAGVYYLRYGNNKTDSIKLEHW